MKDVTERWGKVCAFIDFSVVVVDEERSRGVYRCTKLTCHVVGIWDGAEESCVRRYFGKTSGNLSRLRRFR